MSVNIQRESLLYRQLCGIAIGSVDWTLESLIENRNGDVEVWLRDLDEEAEKEAGKRFH